MKAAQWDAMTRNERITTAARAGWRTKRGEPSVVARRLSFLCWSELTAAARNVLARWNPGKQD